MVPLRATFGRLAALALTSALLTSCKPAHRFWQRHTRAGRAEVAAQRAHAARVQRGRVTYVRYCALCHRADGLGYAADHANALANQQFLAVASPAFLRSAIVDGRPGTPMSAWGRVHGGPLDDRTVDDLVVFLRSRARVPRVDVENVHVSGHPDDVRALWIERCKNCHGATGEGSTTATSLTHPNFLHTVSDGYLRYTITHGRPGTPMQSFPALPAQTVDDLVALIRSMQHFPGPPPPPNYEPPPGLDHLVLNPTGGPPSFTLREGRFVSSADVAQALHDGRRMVILDARATSDWSRSHIAGALPFPFYDIQDMTGRLPHDGTWILAYCACPHAASGHVVDELRTRHFANTAVIDEGIGFWESHGYPVAHAAIVGAPADAVVGAPPAVVAPSAVGPKP